VWPQSGRRQIVEDAWRPRLLKNYTGFGAKIAGEATACISGTFQVAATAA